jgi:hypothetical protein
MGHQPDSRAHPEDSSGYTETVKSYLTETMKADLDREADRRGVSRSAVIREYCRRGLRQDREGELAAETEAARHLHDIIDAGLDDMEDVAQEIEAVNAKTGMYAIATFELVKRDHPEGVIADAVEAGARRLQAEERPDVDAGTSSSPADREEQSILEELRDEDATDEPER